MPFEGPGLLGTAARAAGVPVRPVRVYVGDPVPRVDEVQGVVVMGGPMGALDDAAHPSLPAERALLAGAVAAGVPVLGVCLGAQLLAAAAGAEVTRAPVPEHGVGAVTLTAEGVADPLLGGLGDDLPVVHWHGDTFGIPDAAVRLAGSAECENQAFRLGPRAWGLQFHVEVDPALVDAWTPHLPPGMSLDGDLGAVEAVGRVVARRFVALVAKGG